jgi:hypothetical protein
MYSTESKKISVKSITGEEEFKQVTAIMYDQNGNPIQTTNQLQILGCDVLECVIDVPKFDSKVEEMISKRKDEAMKTELAKQSALRAKQDAITTEEQGKANVAKAKYEEEVIKEKAVVVATRKFEVQQLATKEAAERKKAVILAAQAKKQELLIADGLSELARYKIDAEVRQAIGVAQHMSKWVGPEIVMTGGSGGNGGGVQDALMITMMQDLVKTKKK